jgi:alpha-beta hydrolase superfamily lysophospholipase
MGKSNETSEGKNVPAQGETRGEKLLRFLGRPLRWAVDLALVVVAVLATLAVGNALVSLRQPDLKPWHRVRLHTEFAAKDLASTKSLEDYLRREDRLFAEMEEKIVRPLDPRDRLPWNRYFYGGRAYLEAPDPPRNWNGTNELIPDGPVKGGVLLLHGLTDSPYSVRSIAETYRKAGFYAVVLRIPGHGTIPAALMDVGWRDWRAAVKVGARAVRSRVGPAVPFHVVGYSNGGALALQYAMESVEGSGEAPPDQLVLLSPMIGVSPFARLAPVVGWMGRFQPFEKARWLDVMPEYIPYKYNSFPVRAGHESYLLTKVIRSQVERLEKAGLLGRLPPILGFMSAVDDTVDTGAVVESLYDRLPVGRGDELVIFDLNGGAEVGPFIKFSGQDHLAKLLKDHERHYRLSVVMNENPGTKEVVERSLEAGSDRVAVRPLGASWPKQVFSLSHVALPVPPEDPVYGLDGSVGGVAPRGERGVLLVPEAQFMRLYCNPFFGYVREKLEELTAAKPRPH